MRVGYQSAERREFSVATFAFFVSVCFLVFPLMGHAQDGPEPKTAQEDKKPQTDDPKPTKKRQGGESPKTPKASKKKSRAPKEATVKRGKSDSKESKPKDKVAETKGKHNEPDSADMAKQDAESKTAKSHDERIEALEKKISALLKIVQQKTEEAASKSKPPVESDAKQSAKVKNDSPDDTPKSSIKQPTDGPKENDSAADKKQADQTLTKPPAKPIAQSKPANRPSGVKIESQWMDRLAWRAIGPANMSGRIADISVDDEDPSLWWIGTAGAGLLKTTNHGVKLQHQFDHETTSSIGAVAHSVSNKNIVWVGTGEANPRNSVSYGNGVYKSIDGGKTWAHKGLDKTFQIARILIHPKNPDVVYVGAAGRLYGASRERGVYKTTDGGETWEQVLHVDDNTGVIDMIMNPQDPEMIIVAMWDRMRDGFDSWPGSVKKPDGIDRYDPIRKWGPGAGLFKTVNGGDNWKRLTNGLPPGKLGRVGLDWQRKASGTIYAIIDCEDIGKGPKPFEAYLGLVGADRVNGRDGSVAVITQVMPESPAAKAKIRVGDVLVEIDGKEVQSFDDLLEVQRNKKLGQKIQLALSRKNESIEIEVKLTGRPGSNARMPTVYLGVTGETKESKVVLKSVAEKTPGASAGLKAGDVVVAAEGKPVKSYEALVKLIQSKSDGDKLVLDVKRGEAKLKLTATLVNQRRATPQTNSRTFMGIQGEDQPGGGAKMLVITKGGPSAKAGLKAGDVVKKVAGKDVSSTLR